MGINGNGKFALSSVNSPIFLNRNITVAHTGSGSGNSLLYFNSMEMNGKSLRATSNMGFMADSPVITNSITGNSWIYGSGACSWFARSGGLPTPETVRFGTRNGLFLYGRDAYNNTMINSITGSSSYTVPHGQMNDGPVYIRNNRDNLTVTFLGSFSCHGMNINPNYLYISPTSGALNVILENSTFGCGDYNFSVIGEDKSNTQHNLTLHNSVILTGRIAANYSSLKNNKWNLHASGDSRIYSYRSGYDIENNFTLFDTVPSNNLQTFAYGGNVEYGLRHGGSSAYNNGNSPVTYNHIGFGVPLYEKAYPYASKVSPTGLWTKAIPKVITGEYVESFPLGTNTPQGDGFRYYQVDAVAGDAIVTANISGSIDSYIQIYSDKNFQNLIGDYDDFYNGNFTETISKFIFPETRTYWIGIGTYSSYSNYTYVSVPNNVMEVKYVKDADVTGYCTITNPYTYDRAPTVDTLEFNGGIWDYGSAWWEGSGYLDSMKLNNLYIQKNMDVKVDSSITYINDVEISGTYLNNTDIPNLTNDLNVKVYGRYVFRPNHTIQDVNANGGERLNIVRNKDIGNTQNFVFRRPW
jgi:hypothetical protein